MTDAPRDPAAVEAATDLLLAVARRLEAVDRLTATSAGGTLADEPMLTAVARTATVVLEAQAASIALHQPADDRLVFVAAAGPAAGDVVGLGIDAAAGIAGYAFSTGQPLAVADVSADPRFDRTIAEATGYVPRSLLATPLIDELGTIGVLEVLDRRDGTFSLRDLDLAATLAAEATIIVRRSQTGREATRLLRGALTSLVAADAASADAPPRDIDIDAIVSGLAARLAEDADDPTWRLADQLARLLASDPDRLELAVDWLDALLRRTDRHAGRSGSAGAGRR
ncbi:MAG: GAF domain-containing protein [Candidatus Limnocylindrales bacterium]